MKYCVYEYYEDENATQPYYVGEGVTNSRPYEHHPPTKGVIERAEKCGNRISSNLKQIIKSGNITPKDKSLIKIVKKNLTKMEALYGESKLIKKYRRLLMPVIPNKNASLLNWDGGFDDDLLRLFQHQPDTVEKLNEAYETALRETKKNYTIRTYRDHERLLSAWYVDENKSTNKSTRNGRTSKLIKNKEKISRLEDGLTNSLRGTINCVSKLKKKTGEIKLTQQQRKLYKELSLLMDKECGVV